MKNLDREPAELEQYCTLYEKIPAICFILDAAGFIRGVSQFGAIRLGYCSEELIGQSIFTAFPQTRSQHSSVLSCFRCHDCRGAIARKIIADSAPVNRHTPYCIQEKGGKSLWVRAATRLVSTDSGAIVLLVWEELTDSDFEAQFTPNCDRPEQRVAALTSANKQLQQELQKYRQVAKAATQSATALRESERRFRTINEIGERKRAEEALRESKERYRSVIAAIAEGVVLQQADGQITACNASAEKILGLSTQQILGRTSVDPRWQAIREDGSPFPGENHPAIVTLLTGKPQSNVVMGIHKPEGTTTWISINSQPLWHPEDEHPYAVVTSFSDITVRKQAEVALRASEAKYRTLVEKIPAVTYVASLDRISSALYISPQIQTLLGYSPEEWLDRADLWYESLYPDDRERVLAQLRDCRLRDRPFVSEYRSVARTGEVVWVRDDATIVKDETGRPLFLQGIVFDITERKQAEVALRFRVEQERLTSAIAQHIRRSLHLAEILDTTVSDVRQLLQADRVLLLRLSRDGIGEIVTEAVGAGWSATLGTVFPDNEFPLEVYDRYCQGYPRAINNIHSDEIAACLVDYLQQLGVKSKLVVPILRDSAATAERSQLWGLLIVHQCRTLRQWQTFEIELLQQLATSVAIAIQQAELYHQLELANQQLKHLATLDGLTQLANRRKFDNYLEQEWRRLARERAPLSLILGDIDFFKRYNDTYGHQTGDECLQQVARALEKAAKRPADLVARYGGEEFAAILPNTPTMGAMQVAETIRANVRELEMNHADSGVSEYVTLSLGVASLIPNPDRSPVDLIAAADKALYRAKAEGRDRVILAQN